MLSRENNNNNSMESDNFYSFAERLGIADLELDFVTFIGYIQSRFGFFGKTVKFEQELDMYIPYIDLTRTLQGACKIYSPLHKPAKTKGNINIALLFKDNSPITMEETIIEVPYRIFANSSFCELFNKFCCCGIANDSSLSDEKDGLNDFLETIEYLEKFIGVQLDFSFTSQFTRRTYTRQEIADFFNE